MKLYITTTSPYARIVRIAAFEKCLLDRIEFVVARTRTADSPYYEINPSGRVPYLVLEDGTGLEESTLICRYLDRLDGTPMFDQPDGEAGWQSRRLEALARSLLDGLAVWGRELRRPPEDRSPTILDHERERARRLTDRWEREISNLRAHGPLDLAQISLVCALQLEILNPDFKWRRGRPALSEWADQMTEHASIAATVPPAR